MTDDLSLPKSHAQLDTFVGLGGDLEIFFQQVSKLYHRLDIE